MRPVPRLVAIATAVPSFVLDQEAVVAHARCVFAGAPDAPEVAEVFA